MATPTKPIPVAQDWLAALERLAVHHGCSVDEFLAWAELLPVRPKRIHCSRCGRDSEVVGRYPSIVRRAPGDPFRLVLSLRVFESGVTDVYGLEADEVGYFCSGCAKMTVEPAFRILRMLNPGELAAVGSDGSPMGKAIGFVNGLFGGKLKLTPKALEEGHAGDRPQVRAITDGEAGQRPVASPPQRTPGVDAEIARTTPGQSLRLKGDQDDGTDRGPSS